MTDRLAYVPRKPDTMSMFKLFLFALSGLTSLTIIGTVAFGLWVMTP